MLNPVVGSDLAHIAEKDNEKSPLSNPEGSEVVSPKMTAVLKPAPLPKVASEENSPDYKVEEETPRLSKKSKDKKSDGNKLRNFHQMRQRRS